MKLSFNKGERPLKDVHCPVCHTRAIYIRRKACCGNCGWNIENVRRYLWRTIGQASVGYFIALPFWYAFGGLQSLMFLGTFAALVGIIGAVTLGRDFRKIPSVQVRSQAPAEPIFKLLPHPRLARKPPGRWIIQGVVTVVASVLVLVFLPHELFLKQTNSAGMYAVLAAYAFALYILVSHAVELFRLGREWLTESRLATRAEMTLGRVVDQTPDVKSPNTVVYEFRDGFNNLRHGSGKDYSDLLFEGMQIAVLFDPDDSSWNLPACGLNFHLLAAEEPVLARPNG